jgi:hypothetical protein
MKKITLFAFAAVALSFASCKKDRTCECTQTNSTTTVAQNGNSTTVASTSNSTTTIKEIKKSEAKTLCQKKTSTNTYPNNSNTGMNSSSTTYDCKIK